jgi:hypothetical protein
MLRKIKLLYERLTRIGDKQKLKWATASLAIILSASVAKAGYTDPVSLSGFRVGFYAAPAFVDLDDDGDLDIVVGKSNGYLDYFQNDGGSYTQLTGSENPFDAIDVGSYSTPTFADVDDDGDMDLLVGRSDGYLNYFQNDGTGVFTEITGPLNPFDGIDVGYESNPVFADIDNDGDIDLVVGEYWGNINYFQNDGFGVFTELSGVLNPFDAILVWYYSSPDFADFDDDGDLDLFIGDGDGYISYYQHDGLSFIEQTGNANPFDGIDFGDVVSPVMIDVDLDGDFDLVAGTYNDLFLRYLRNDAGTFSEKRGTLSPFEGIQVIYHAKPIFADIDGDANLDLVIGDMAGTISYYKDTLNGFIPKVGAENPFAGIDVGIASTPAMGNFDDDGDLDLFVGDKYGTILYYKNNAGTYVQQTGADNPMNGVDVGAYSDPVLVDFDNDNDLDLVVGNYNGTINYFRNDEPVFAELTGAVNPFNGIDVGFYSSPALVDFDNDGDLDLVVGNNNGTINYFRNDEPVYTELTGADNPFNGIDIGYFSAPALVDLDNDGDFDLYLGDVNGKVYFSEFNVPGITASPSSGLITTEAGGTDIFTLVLNSQPDHHVTITLTSNKPSEGTVSPVVLTFTHTTWNVPQIVTLTGVDDDDEDGNQDYHISFAVSSTDAEYNGMIISNVNASNADDDGVTSVEPVTAGAIKVYSVDHSIMLVSEDKIIDKVKVYDLSGQLIIQKNIGTTGTYELFVPGSQSGVYVIQTFTEDDVLRTKVIIR